MATTPTPTAKLKTAAKLKSAPELKVKLVAETKVTRRLIVQGHIMLPELKTTIRLKGVVKGVQLSVARKVKGRGYYASEYTETDQVTIPLAALRQLAELMTALADEYAPKSGLVMPAEAGERDLVGKQ